MGGTWEDIACDACGADAGEDCSPFCVGLAVFEEAQADWDEVGSL